MALSTRTLVAVVGLLAIPLLAAGSPFANNAEFIAENNSRDVNDDNGFDEMTLLDNLRSDILLGNVPYGTVVIEDNLAACPVPTSGQTSGEYYNNGKQVVRYFYGATNSPNGVNGGDASHTSCNSDSTLGDTAGAAGESFFTYYWTVDSNGCPCALDPSLGTVDVADENDVQVAANICAITSGWEGYVDVTYGSSCAISNPPALVGQYVMPADVARAADGQTNTNTVHTYGCLLVPTSPLLCYTKVGSDFVKTTEECTYECYTQYIDDPDWQAEFGSSGACAFHDNKENVMDATDNTATQKMFWEWKSLDFVEMVAEIAFQIGDGPPPDVYLYKPTPSQPDGLPYNVAGFSRNDPDTWSDGMVQSRVVTYWGANSSLTYYKSSGGSNGMCKYGSNGYQFDYGCMDSVQGDLILKMSTDNFHGTYAGSAGIPAFLLFDDQAVMDARNYGHDESNPTADQAWGSGSYKPEDPLRVYSNRRYTPAGLDSRGAGTWGLVVVDDCDMSTGQGSVVLSWQLHMICKQPEFCMKSCYACGDPHMVGFKGQKFDYHGQPGAFFNVLSTPKTQFNALLKPELVDGLTYIGSVGIQLDSGSKVMVSAANDELIVELNDRMVAVDEISDDIAVEFLSDITVRVITPEVTAMLTFHKGQFLDVVSIDMNAAPEAIHGVLGVTASQVEGTYQGDEADYFVSNLWATDFKFNLFRSGAKRTVAKKLGPIAKEAAFEMSELVSAGTMMQGRK